MSSPTPENTPLSEAPIDEMWADETVSIAQIDPHTENWKSTPLPLARIKKIMKSEELVCQEMERERLQATSGGIEIPSTRFMIAGEAPLLMSKACELMIKELTSRSWRYTERSRRRTLQKQDVCAGVGESETFDFLIDIVPRNPPAQAATQGVLGSVVGNSTISDALGMVGGPIGSSNGTDSGQDQTMMLATQTDHLQQMPGELQGQYLLSQNSSKGERGEVVAEQSESGMPGREFSMDQQSDGTLLQNQNWDIAGPDQPPDES